MTDSAKPKKDSAAKNDAAVSLVRQKLDAVYNNEPNAKEEAKEVTTAAKPLSKHQAYMQEISQSGRSLAEIQTAWHNYYVALPDNEKHEVWQEFYAEHDRRQSGQSTQVEPAKSTGSDKKASAKSDGKLPSQNMSLPSEGKPTVHQVSQRPPAAKKKPGSRTVSEVKHQLTHKASVSANHKLKAKQHFQSLLFGVSMGLIAVVILLFGFFNEAFIAPFISPSRNVTNTPIIIDGSTAVGSQSKILIPKINVEIPVVYDEPSVEEHAVQNALERGVVHYATTPSPGEKGNAVFFGHSSNNILNKGKYKFAFVLLKRLEVDDVFYLNKDGVRYAYKVYSKKIVDPNQVNVLNSNDKVATATLITCDPPGTTRHRLVVIGEQISPEPAKNVASTATKADVETTTLASNAPSLWQRIKDWL